LFQIWTHLIGLVGIGDVEVVEPLLAENVPAGGQHDDPSRGSGGEVVLDAAIAERVIHAVLLRLAADRGFRNVICAVGLAQDVRRPPQLELAAREVAFHAGSGGRLDHFAMPRSGPFAVNFGMASGTGRSSDVRCAGGSGRSCRRRQYQEYPSGDHLIVYDNTGPMLVISTCGLVP
jgi:hypothetical protein